jgi:hypothetical protein
MRSRASHSGISPHWSLRASRWSPRCDGRSTRRCGRSWSSRSRSESSRSPTSRAPRWPSCRSASTSFDGGPASLLTVPRSDLDRATRIRDLMAMVDLDASLLRRRPDQLSGGQQQRVALAARGSRDAAADAARRTFFGARCGAPCEHAQGDRGSSRCRRRHDDPGHARSGRSALLCRSSRSHSRRSPILLRRKTIASKAL